LVKKSKNWEFFIKIDFFCVSKLSIDLFFKLPVSRFLAINIEGKIGQLTVRRTSSFIIFETTAQIPEVEFGGKYGYVRTYLP
jgi:hypothetical protein